MSRTAQKPPLFSLTSGPVEVYPEILRAMARQLPYDFDPYYQDFYERTSDLLKTAMRADSHPIVLQADPVLGAEAAAASLIAEGDVVLNLVSGVYSKGFGDYARPHAGEVVEHAVPFNEAIDPEDVRRLLRERPDVKVISVLHHDTPSGTINPVHAIGKVVREMSDAVLIVDATSAFGGMDSQPTEMGADFYITGSSKCLGAPPGLTMVYASERGWRKMEANPRAPRNSILSVLDWRESWSRNRPFPFTTSGAEIHALEAALVLYLDEGPEQVWKRHASTAAAFRAGVRALGLSLWPAREEIASPSCTAVRVPDGLTDEAILAAVRRHFGVALAPGRAETKGKLIRIGHMGLTANPSYALLALTALGGALNAIGFKAPTGTAVDAALAELRTRGS